MRVPDLESLIVASELVGPWEVRYPGPDLMIRQDCVEQLELREDGSYSWMPHPLWSRGLGRWGLLLVSPGIYQLCLENRNRALNKNFLVAIDFEGNGSLVLNWQRTSCDAVVFADRIFQACRPANWLPKPVQ